MALKQSEAEKSLEERIAQTRRTFTVSSEKLALREAMMGVGSKPVHKSKKPRKSLPAIGGTAAPALPSGSRHHRRRSLNDDAMTTIIEINSGGKRGGEGGAVRLVRRPSLKVKAVSELREVQQKAREAESDRVARARGLQRAGSVRKGSFADGSSPL